MAYLQKMDIGRASDELNEDKAKAIPNGDQFLAVAGSRSGTFVVASKPAPVANVELDLCRKRTVSDAMTRTGVLVPTRIGIVHFRIICTSSPSLICIVFLFFFILFAIFFCIYIATFV